MTIMHEPPLTRSEKWKIDEVRKARVRARAAATAKIQEMHSGLSENEQALFLAIEQHLGLDKETCIGNLRIHNRKELDRLISEEYARNLETLRKNPKWIEESFKTFETAVIPVKPANEQKILGWGFRFKDEVTGSKSPPIREIVRQKPIELPDVLLLTHRNRFIEEVRNRYDGKVFEHVFDRMQVGWAPGKHGFERYFAVKFMLRTPWCRVTIEK